MSKTQKQTGTPEPFSEVCHLAVLRTQLGGPRPERDPPQRSCGWKQVAVSSSPPWCLPDPKPPEGPGGRDSPAFVDGPRARHTLEKGFLWPHRLGTTFGGDGDPSFSLSLFPSLCTWHLPLTRGDHVPAECPQSLALGGAPRTAVGKTCELRGGQTWWKRGATQRKNIWVRPGTLPVQPGNCLYLKNTNPLVGSTKKVVWGNLMKT